jgi:hypothetical protein
MNNTHITLLTCIKTNNKKLMMLLKHPCYISRHNPGPGECLGKTPG